MVRGRDVLVYTSMGGRARAGLKQMSLRQNERTGAKGPPDMMSTSEGEGGHGKADIDRRLHEFYATNQFQMQTRGRGSTNLKFLWTSLMEAPKVYHHFWRATTAKSVALLRLWAALILPAKRARGERGRKEERLLLRLELGKKRRCGCWRASGRTKFHHAVLSAT